MVIYKNAKIGRDPTIEDFTILGKPPRGAKPGQLELIMHAHKISWVLLARAFKIAF